MAHYLLPVLKATFLNLLSLFLNLDIPCLWKINCHLACFLVWMDLCCLFYNLFLDMDFLIKYLNCNLMKRLHNLFVGFVICPFQNLNHQVLLQICFVLRFSLYYSKFFIFEIFFLNFLIYPLMKSYFIGKFNFLNY